MVPNVSQEIVLQLKNLKPGNCIAFGSAFKVPTAMYIEIPNPRPLSNNVDLETVWYKEKEMNQNIGTPNPNQVNSAMMAMIQNNSQQIQQPMQQVVTPPQQAVQSGIVSTLSTGIVSPQQLPSQQIAAQPAV